MIKAKTTNGDLILGITNGNIKKLKKGQPMKINMSEVGMGDRTIYIVYGPTEEDIAASLQVDINIKTKGNA